MGNATQLWQSYLHTYRSTCLRTYLLACMHTRIYVYVCMCMYVCMYVCMYNTTCRANVGFQTCKLWNPEREAARTARPRIGSPRLQCLLARSGHTLIPRRPWWKFSRSSNPHDWENLQNRTSVWHSKRNWYFIRKHYRDVLKDFLKDLGSAPTSDSLGPLQLTSMSLFRTRYLIRESYNPP